MPERQMTPDDVNQDLLSLARRVCGGYVAATQPRAILLTGSIARVEGDRFSDIDMIAYYDEVPDAETVFDARSTIEDASDRPATGEPQRFVADFFSIQGVECQVMHQTIQLVEEDIDAILEDNSVDSLLHKKAIGIVEGSALHGADLIQVWQDVLARYPDALATAMVTHYLGQIFPFWYLQEYLLARDATLWRHQLAVESIQNVLGVLAGLNHRYYSTFQFKRMHRFIECLEVAPNDLARRIDSLLSADLGTAPDEIERLVQETIHLLNLHMPDVSTSQIEEWLGRRQEPWSIDAP